MTKCNIYYYYSLLQCSPIQRHEIIGADKDDPALVAAAAAVLVSLAAAAAAVVTACPGEG